MSKIDETNAVTQESLEKQPTGQPQYEVKMEGYDAPPVQETQPEVQQNEEVTNTNTEPDGVAELIEDPTPVQEQKEVQPEEPAVQEEVIDIDDSVQDAPTVETVAEPKADALPEWIQKLKDFQEETGGGLEEYQAYTKDYDSLNETDLLKQFYKLTKPGYTNEDIDLTLEAKFGVEKVADGEEMSREDKLKLLALKDEVATARTFLKTNKEKYYVDLKSGVHGAPEQYKEAVQFYNDSQKQAESQKAIRKTFINQSKEVFNESFKGFPFESGDKKYRIKVGDGQAVMNSQLDLNQVVGKFLNEDGSIADTAGWHKALWSAQNSDKLFNAGVEAGKALALKERAQATKNPSYTPEGPSKPPQAQPTVRFLGPDDGNY